MYMYIYEAHRIAYGQKEHDMEIAVGISFFHPLGGLLRQAAPMLLPPLLEALQRKPTDPGCSASTLAQIKCGKNGE